MTHDQRTRNDALEEAACLMEVRDDAASAVAIRALKRDPPAPMPVAAAEGNVFDERSIRRQAYRKVAALVQAEIDRAAPEAVESLDPLLVELAGIMDAMSAAGAAEDDRAD